MNELSLFTGAGGGLLASHLLGWRCVGAVEIEAYPCSILEARQRDGMLPYFPIFQTDIRDFVREGYAALYKGKCDIISAGFPCTPFSNAGQQLGEDDPRNMWPSTLACIREVRPRSLLLENVPGLLTSGYFGTILGQLSDSGYDCRWRILSAAELGAPHLRKRLWIVAHSHGARQLQSQRFISEQRGRSSNNSEKISHSASKRLENGNARTVHQSRAQQRFERCNWWEVEPDVGRVVAKLASRVDRLKSLGNGQVPIVAARAWELLNEF